MRKDLNIGGEARTKYEDIIDSSIRPRHYIYAHQERKYHWDSESGVDKHQSIPGHTCSLRLKS